MVYFYVCCILKKDPVGGLVEVASAGALKVVGSIPWAAAHLQTLKDCTCVIRYLALGTEEI